VDLQLGRLKITFYELFLSESDLQNFNLAVISSERATLEVCKTLLVKSERVTVFNVRHVDPLE